MVENKRDVILLGGDEPKKDEEEIIPEEEMEPYGKIEQYNPFDMNQFVGKVLVGRDGGGLFPILEDLIYRQTDRQGNIIGEPEEGNYRIVAIAGIPEKYAPFLDRCFNDTLEYEKIKTLVQEKGVLPEAGEKFVVLAERHVRLKKSGKKKSYSLAAKSKLGGFSPRSARDLVSFTNDNK
jgi:hypothetical protein